MEIVFSLPGLPKRYNATKGGHWATLAREAKKWHEAVYWATRSQKPAEPFKYAYIECVRASSVAPDYDGLVQSFKPIIDGLRYAKIIQDDKLINIGMPNYSWIPTPKNKGYIWVRVLEVNGSLEPTVPRNFFIEAKK